MGHALTRTSPKGGPFIGTCMKCGTEGLTLSQMHQECANPANLTQDETLLLAVHDRGLKPLVETGTGSIGEADESPGSASAEIAHPFPSHRR